MRDRKIRPERVMKEAERLKKLKRKPVPKEFWEKFLAEQKKSNSGDRSKDA